MPTIREQLEAETRAWRAMFDTASANAATGRPNAPADHLAMFEQSKNIAGWSRPYGPRPSSW